MRRSVCALIAAGLASEVQAQQLPGRDLFEFPISALAEGTALALFAGDGLRNPASIYVSPSERGRLSLTSLATGREQRVSAQTLAVAYTTYGTTAGLSVARSSVGDIARTDTDPQTIGADVPYGLVVVSVAAARRERTLTSGIAVRYQSGELDTERRQELGLDAGVIVDSVAGRDVTVAASSFLWRPGGAGGRSGAAFSGAIEAKALALGWWQGAHLRAGYAWTGVPQASNEHFGYVSLRTRVWDARVGGARVFTRNDATNRLRIALGARSGRYRLGVSREESPYGLSPAYVFMLVTHLAAP
ncbi:MAG TPA: hypothetical protein VJ717_11535 [Gemmatimonadaceae bacterium]|nr:hypothetical protein [Gemmatimonadaceae bacterium]